MNTSIGFLASTLDRRARAYKVSHSRVEALTICAIISAPICGLIHLLPISLQLRGDLINHGEGLLLRGRRNPNVEGDMTSAKIDQLATLVIAEGVTAFSVSP
jgi:hypothetical protein